MKYLVKMYLTGIAFFTFFRLLFLFVNRAVLETIRPGKGIWLSTFLMGLRYDTVISCYILVLPGILLLTADITKYSNGRALRPLHYFICSLYLAAFLACAADIPFFLSFNSRLNVTILNWSDSPMFMLKMVLEEKSFLAYLLLFILIAIAYLATVRKIYLRNRADIRWEPPARKRAHRTGFLAVFLFAGCMVLGIRGRTEQKTPINTGTAYFCEYELLNNAALNPVFTFIYSYIEIRKPENKTLHLMDDGAAIALARQYLGITGTNSAAPLAREVVDTMKQEKYNVVLVLMESMAAFYMDRFAHTADLTPNLDTLAARGYSFDNFYSAGLHTFNGIFSTLYAYPALMARHTMYIDPIPHYTGLPYLMKQQGYKTIYFTTHDDQFDNVGGFLRANYVDRIVSQADYPSSEVINALGVPDHFMFNYALPILNDYHRQGRPFFATLMTVSNHPPYEVPGDISFKAKHTDINSGCVEYADWSIGQFMKQAAKQAWFPHTIFVFLGDHGAWANDPYGDLHRELNHIPCIIYSPVLKDAPRIFNEPAGQIDIFPTLAGLLHFSYNNNTVGIDLLHQSRPWIYFGSDDKFGVLGRGKLYVWYNNGRENLFDLASKAEILAVNRPLADSMRDYAFAMMQTSQWMLRNGKTGAGQQAR